MEHLDKHQAYYFYKAVQVFDSRQLPSVSHDIGNYIAHASLEIFSQQLLEEWLIHMQYSEALPTPFNLPNFWHSAKYDRFRLLSAIAVEIVWMPATAVEVGMKLFQL